VLPEGASDLLHHAVRCSLDFLQHFIVAVLLDLLLVFPVLQELPDQDLNLVGVRPVEVISIESEIDRGGLAGQEPV
jgi:hypothetical protein